MKKTDFEGPSVPITPSIRGANFWIRAVAHTIDFTILFLFSCLISLPLFLRMIREGLAADPMALSYPLWVDLVFQLIIAVAVISLWRKTQTTPGKALFKLQIVDLKTGGRPSIPRLIVRFFGYAVAMVPIPAPLFVRVFPSLGDSPIFGFAFREWKMLIPLMFGFLWILIDSRNRGWHDLMSGTVTVRKAESRPKPTP